MKEKNNKRKPRGRIWGQQLVQCKKVRFLFLHVSPSSRVAGNRVNFEKCSLLARHVSTQLAARRLTTDEAPAPALPTPHLPVWRFLNDCPTLTENGNALPLEQGFQFGSQCSLQARHVSTQLAARWLTTDEAPNNYPTLSKDVNALLSDNPSLITDIRLFVHTYVSHYVCILYVTYHFPPYVRHTKLMSYKLIFRNSIELFSW